jgi:hypothetical protein
MKSKLLIVSIFVLCGEALSSGGTSAAPPVRGAIIAEVTNQAKAITGAQGHERRTSAQNCVKDGVPGDSPLWGDVLGDYNGLPVQDCSATRSSPEAPGGKLTGRAALVADRGTSRRMDRVSLRSAQSKRRRAPKLRQDRSCVRERAGRRLAPIRRRRRPTPPATERTRFVAGDRGQPRRAIHLRESEIRTISLV